MLDLEFVSNFIYENFESVTPSQNGTHFHARCLFCGDSKKSLRKKRFHCDYNNGNPMYHCFNCDVSGSFLEMYSQIKGITIDEAKKELYNYNPEYLTQKLSTRKKERYIKEAKHENHNWILDDCISDTISPVGILESAYYNLLNVFRIERKIPKEYKLFYAYKGDYAGRIIIPIYDKNRNILYFQGRAIDEITEAERKYKNPTTAKGNIILNKHLFDRNKFIVITEGLLDAMVVSYNQGTSYLGKTITDEFLEKILPLTDEGIIVVNDIDKDGIKTLNRLFFGSKKSNPSKYYKKLFYFSMPEKYKGIKDMNQLVTEMNIENTYKFIVENSYTFTNFYVKTKLKF